MVFVKMQRVPERRQFNKTIHHVSVCKIRPSLFFLIKMSAGGSHGEENQSLMLLSCKNRRGFMLPENGSCRSLECFAQPVCSSVVAPTRSN